MAAPPPYWKKKTRPCPFYSQGRCLFSDACNFVHSVKVAHEAPPSSGAGLEGHGGSENARDSKVLGGEEEGGDSVKEKRWSEMQTPVMGAISSLSTRSSSRSSVSGSLSRTPSEKRRRVVLMSPPRSPRLSGLLSALESVIGPDVEEVEVTGEEDEWEGGGEEEQREEDEGREGWQQSPSQVERRAEESGLLKGVQHDERPGESMLALETDSPLPASSSASALSSRESTSLAYYRQDSPALALTPVPEERDIHVLPSDVLPPLSTPSKSDFTASEDNDNGNDAPAHANLDSNSPPIPSPKRPVPVAPQSPPPQPAQRPTLRSRVPSPIITQRLDRNDEIATTTVVLDDNTLEVHSHPHPQSHHQDTHHLHEHNHSSDLDHHSQHQHLAHNQNHVHDHNHNHFRTSTDDPLTPSRGSRRHSTFELLTSPFTSPAQRIASLSPLSPKLFSAVDPSSPAFGHGVLAQQHSHHHDQYQQDQGRASSDEKSLGARRPYADDDVDSLETIETSEIAGSLESFGHASGSDETAITIDSNDLPHLDEKSEGGIGEEEDVGSPHETERPSSEYSRTPRNGPSIHVQAATVESELGSLPPLPPSAVDDSFEAKDLEGHEGSDAERELSTAPVRCVPLLSQEAAESSSISSPPVAARDESRTSLSGSTHSEDQGPPSPRETIARLQQDADQGSVAAHSAKCTPNGTVGGADDDRQDDIPSRESAKEASPRPTKISTQDFAEVRSHANRLESPERINGENGRHTTRGGEAMTVQRSSLHLATIATSGNRNNSLESPATLSFGPSPVTPDYASSRVPEAIVEVQEGESSSTPETILQRRTKHTNGSPKRLSVVSISSPTKELRESFFPASLERTVRPSPSPLYEESQHSASDSTGSSSAASSPRPSWAELQKRSGISNKVPFGFRQSLLVGQEDSSSLARKLATQFSCDSSNSRTSSTSSLSPTSAFQPRRVSRVDMLSGRARSVSPALIAAGPSSWRHSVAAPHSNSDPSPQAGSSSSTLPHSAQAEFFMDRSRSESPPQLGDPGPSSSARRASWMKPLRLSQVYSSTSPQSRRSSLLSQSNRLSTSSVPSSQAHVRNTSQGSAVQNVEPSSARSSLISTYLNDLSIPSQGDLTIIPPAESTLPSMESVLANSTSEASADRPETGHQHSQSTGSVDQEAGSATDLLSPLSGSMRGLNFEELAHYRWPDSNRNSVHVPLIEDIPPDQPGPSTSYQDTLIPSASTTPAPAHAAAAIPTPCHAIATPRPTLMFAIASDNPAEVERVLASGEARPNDDIGPQSALEFTLTNDALVNKTEIVKTLLAYGADVSSLSPELRNTHDQQPSAESEEKEKEDVVTGLPTEGTNGSISKRKKRESALNPAMKYYLNRATAGPQAAQPSAALRRSDFRSLARMRFDFIGQDRALEHLYWALGMHSQQPIGTPLVVLCCGPNGHGKSLLARKFGSLLNVPTHTVNMTVLKTSHDLWQCPSMSPYDPPSDRTLAEFLEENAGKRCVVVLDEIDKNEDERTLWSLLAPWELGRCSIDAERRHIDVRNVIWIGTSNIGQDLIFAHHASRKEPDTVMSKAEYRELMNSLRPLVTDKLGTSLMSRVTAVLPFVPFTSEEKLAIASEAILSLGGEDASELDSDDFERLALQCISEYIESDGARSLYRSVSTHLMEAL